MTVNEYYNIYSKDQMNSMARNTWYSRLNLLLNHALPSIGDMELKDVRPDHIHAVYNTMESEGLKQNTIFGMYAAFRSFFTSACEDGYVSENVMNSTRPIKPDLTI